MAEKSSFNFPVSPLVGSSFGNYLRIVSGKKIHPKYISRFLLTTIASGVLDPFGRGEKLIKSKIIHNTEINEDPVFIIGFWRSGTTYLHNLLCQDPNHAYVSTYQSIFPHHCLINSVWVKKLAEIIAPDKMPVDNVKLDMNFPQEEEMALGNMQKLSFYNFFYFPHHFESYRKEALLFEGIQNKSIEKWGKEYLITVKKAIIQTGGKRFVSKNPPNTFRIPQLLKMFPDAKFVYIYRNPYHVLSSFILFVDHVIKGVGFQKTDQVNFEKQIFELFKEALDKYEVDKALIPSKNLIEIKYEAFKQEPLQTIENIYAQFDLKNFEQLSTKLKSYNTSQKGQKSGGHFMPEHLTDFIQTELRDYIKEKGYTS
jgi:hypothetical protein